MRITIVQGAFFPVPPLLGGAVEKVWFALGPEFAARGHCVTHLSRRHRDLPMRETIGGVEHVRLRGFDSPRDNLRRKLLDLIYSWRVRRALPAADLLVTNTFFLPMLVRDRRAGRLWVHVARYPRGQMRFYGRAARLQTMSRVIADAIRREAPALASKVTVIPNPVSRADFGPPAARERRILFVGRIHPEKGLDILLRAAALIPAAELRDWRIVIVGPAEARLGGGGERCLEALRALARPLGNLVEWRGPIFDAAALAREFQRASLFIYPTTAEKGEALPLAPVEAMSHGCPVLLSGLSCFDYLESGRNGWSFDHLASPPERALVEVLRRLMSDEGALARAGVAARETADRYSVPQIASQYLAEFEQVLREEPLGNSAPL